MCGRFTLKAPAHALQEAFPLFDLADYPPRHNIAPTQAVLAVRQEPDAPKPHPVLLRWGLVPFWADDLKIGSKFINARGETVADKPAFRNAFKKRRCLILTDGFYEWQPAEKKGGRKQPFHIHRRDQKPFAFAGLWECWDKDGEPVETCTIITTEANATLRPLHDRMPVILDPKDYSRWLSPHSADSDQLQELLVPAPDEALEAVPCEIETTNKRTVEKASTPLDLFAD